MAAASLSGDAASQEQLSQKSSTVAGGLQQAAAGSAAGAGGDHHDLWIDPKGGVYFTDPFYKRDYWQRGAPPELDNSLYASPPSRIDGERVELARPPLLGEWDAGIQRSPAQG